MSSIAPLIMDGAIQANKMAFLYRSVFFPEGASGSIGDDLNSLLTLSEDGATIVAIALNWKPNKVK